MLSLRLKEFVLAKSPLPSDSVPLSLVGAFEPGSVSCSVCGNYAEGIILRDGTGTRIYWCWECSRSLMRAFLTIERHNVALGKQRNR